jgi:hypothetical protein
VEAVVSEQVVRVVVAAVVVAVVVAAADVLLRPQHTVPMMPVMLKY